jgi:competence protein ComGC
MSLKRKLDPGYQDISIYVDVEMYFFLLFIISLVVLVIFVPSLFQYLHQLMI